MATPSGGWQTDLVTVAGLPRLVTEPSCVYVRAAVSDDGAGTIAWTGQPGQAATPIHVWDSAGHTWVGPSGVKGVQSVGIVARPGGGFQITWVQSDLVYRRANLDAQLREISVTRASCPNVTGRQGFLDVQLDSEPIWTDLHRFTWVRPASGDPVALYLWMTRGDWTIGQDAQVDRLLIYRPSTRTLYVAHGAGGQYPSRLAVDEQGQPWVLPAGASRAIGRAEFRAYTPPPFVDEPPATVPTFRAAEHEIKVHVFGGPGFRMNLGPQHDRDASAKPNGAFYTYVADDARLDAQVAYAEAHRVPLHAYEDRKGHAHPLLQGLYEPHPFTRRGLDLRACVKTYPDEDIRHVLSQIDALGKKGYRVSVCLAGYRQMIGHGPKMNWRLTDVIARAEVVWEHVRVKAREFVDDVLIFHQHRESAETGNVDGLDSRPELQLMADRIASAASAYTPPKPPSKPTPPKPPEQPQPEPPVEPEQPSQHLPYPLDGLVELGDVLARGERWYSADGQSWLQLDAIDGHLVRYYRDPGGQITARWDAGIGGALVDRVQLNPDGNLVAYTAYNQPLWASNTANRGIVRMRVDASRLAFLGRNDAVVAQIPRVEEKESKQDMNAVAKVFAALLGFGWLWGRR